ncbi:MAG: hypothetical protein KDC46_06660 [Thermoleophilia bacterium]|nr:hypothetical protein [Thermoleophilia bacterium]
MARRLAHPSRSSASADVSTASTTVGASERVRTMDADRHADLFGDVDPQVRMRMELVARASASADTALPFVVALLVDGDEKRAAIVEAISSNEALDEQWRRTWEVLRR